VDTRTLASSIEVLADPTRPGMAGSVDCRRLPPDLIEPAGHLRQPPTTARMTAPAVDYIANHLDQDLTRRALAALCHRSISEFSRAFKREQGTTFELFLLEHRIAQARDLLADGPATIGQVAYAVGFHDPAYFSRVFRKLVGMTASEYRRRANVPGMCAEGVAARSAPASNDPAR
jgi:AraC-like DNA-binding protein